MTVPLTGMSALAVQFTHDPAVGVGEAVRDADAVAVGVRLGVGEGDGVRDAEGLAVAVGVGLGVAALETQRSNPPAPPARFEKKKSSRLSLVTLGPLSNEDDETAVTSVGVPKSETRSPRVVS